MKTEIEKGGPYDKVCPETKVKCTTGFCLSGGACSIQEVNKHCTCHLSESRCYVHGGLPTPPATVNPSWQDSQGWISVESGELPELETQVIVARPNQYSGNVDVLMAYLYDSGEKGRSYGKMGEFGKWLTGKYWGLPAVTPLNKITHWMPLPQPPSQSSNK